MKILATSDWHLGNLFHGNERLAEHRHFLDWLLRQIEVLQPDALLVAGDVFDNGNPSAAAQSVYYEFLDNAMQACKHVSVIITAGNHDSANRLEAPRALLSRHKIEVRGNVHREWVQHGEDGGWEMDYNDLMIPLAGRDGMQVVVLAVPYLRSDVLQNANYSEGVNDFLRTLTAKARERYPDCRLVMMAHMYAKGADIATNDASERIVIGGQEEVCMEGWTGHPDYMTCGHIHKRQHIWNTDWARYTGSVLPMSFAETDYRHGVDLIDIGDKISTEFIEYTPQHKLCVLSYDDESLTFKKILKNMDNALDDRIDGKLDDNFVYLTIRIRQERVNNDQVKELENLVGTKNAVLCKIQKIIPSLGIATLDGGKKIQSVDDILNRDPLDAIKESFLIEHKVAMSDHQEQMLRELLDGIKDDAVS